MGKVYYSLGRKEEALESYHQALQLTQAVGDRTGEAIALFGIARVHCDRGNLSEARTQIEAALDIIESVRTKVPSSELRATYLASKREYYEFYIDLLMRLHRQESSKGHDAAALLASERARGLLDLLAQATKIDVTQGIAPELKQREQATDARISQIQSQLIQVHSRPSPDRSKIAQLEEELKKMEAKREHLEMEIREKHPRYATLQYPTPLGLEAIQPLLDDQTALLEYALGNEGSWLFVVDRQGLQSYRLPPAKESNLLSQEIRAGLGQPWRREFGQYVVAARKLYEMLVAPAADVLAKKRNLLIAPDGALYYLPFECLLTKETGTSGQADYRGLPYLLKQWSMSFVPSASVLASLRQTSPRAEDRPSGTRPKEFLAFADPVYGEKQEARGKKQEVAASKVPTTESSVKQIVRNIFSEEGRWELQRLTESSREISGIAKRYKSEDVMLYLREAAREENVKGNPLLSTARRVHFATHGLISERQPQYSGLVLTLDEKSKEDGLLQVYEIFNLKLNADLVVLSACRTGLGKEV